MTPPPTTGEPSELVHQALDELAEAEELDASLEEAGHRVRDWLDVALPPFARRSLTLMRELDSDAHGVIDRALARIDDEPALARNLSAAIELFATRFGLPMSGATTELLKTLSDTRANDELARANEILGDVVRRCWRSPAPRDHQRFRCLVLEGADAETRARALSADLPEMLPVARVLIRSELDVDAQLDQLTLEYEGLQKAKAENPPPGDGDQGPAPEVEQDPVHARVAKRRFTWLHLTFAILIVGLFVWQYWWR